MRDLASVILAAGKGTRMKSSLPKVAFEFCDKPMISHVVETAKRVGCKKIVVVVGYKAEAVKDILRGQKDVFFAFQSQQNGTGDAVKVANDALSDFVGDILILYGDVPLIKVGTLKKLIQTHQKCDFACTFITAKLADPASYGRVFVDKRGFVASIIEARDCTTEQLANNEINSGIYCFKSDYLFPHLHKLTNDNDQGEFYLTDMVKILNDMGKRVGRVVVEDVTEISGINSIEELEVLQKVFSKDLRLDIKKK